MDEPADGDHWHHFSAGNAQEEWVPVFLVSEARDCLRPQAFYVLWEKVNAGNQDGGDTVRESAGYVYSSVALKRSGDPHYGMQKAHIVR